jgi:L-fuconate dehydratase
MAVRINSLETFDVRFPTSLTRDGSDAMNEDPDYSAAYLVLHVEDGGELVEGHGFAFTLGRGTEVQIAAIESLAPLVVGADVDELRGDMGGFWRRLVGDSRLRWLGPEKGVMHMATAAIVNAVRDLHSRRAGLPLWKLVATMAPEEIVALVDFRYVEDALTTAEAFALLTDRLPGRAEREAYLLAAGYPAYTTSPGWLGYHDDKLRRLVREALAAGFNKVKLKVGADIEDDLRRCAIAREELGPDRRLVIDANQRWGIEEAIENVRRLAQFAIGWVEEPTSPDDALGHAAIARALPDVAVATGEQVHNRVMFKQLMQAGAMSVCQVDACRLGGVNEVVAVLLLAAKHGVPVCPHAGGVGLCELVQHLATFDYVAVSGTLDGRVVEYVDHLHEHFVDPCTVERGRYRVPTAPGYSTEMRRDSLERYGFPHGEVWAPQIA